MAEDLRGVSSYPYFKIVSTVLHTAMTEIQLPGSCTRVSIGSQSGDFKVAQNGATDGGSVPANFAFGLNNNYLQLDIIPGLQRADSIFVAGATGSVDIYIILERQSR